MPPSSAVVSVSVSKSMMTVKKSLVDVSSKTSVDIIVVASLSLVSVHLSVSSVFSVHPNVDESSVGSSLISSVANSLAVSSVFSTD